MAMEKVGHRVVAIAAWWWPVGGLAIDWWPWGAPWLPSSSLQDEDGNTLSDEDIAAEADTFMFEGEREPLGAIGEGSLTCPLAHPLSPQATTRRPAAWHGCSTTWPAIPTTRNGAARRSASSSRAGTRRRSNGERSPVSSLGHLAWGPRCHHPSPPGRTCPTCPSPPCASRRAFACIPPSPPCPGAAPRTSPCVTDVSSPRVRLAQVARCPQCHCPFLSPCP